MLINRLGRIYLWRLLVSCSVLVFTIGCTGQSSDDNQIDYGFGTNSSRADTFTEGELGGAGDDRGVSDRGKGSENGSDSSRYYIYECDSGRTIEAHYPEVDRAEVEYRGETHQMRVMISASGARYAGEGLEWWTKGTGPGAPGTLYHHQDGETGDVIESCRQSE